MLISPAYAQDGANSFIAQFGGLLPLVAIFVIFYFLILRPQQKRTKEHRAMVEAVKRGDVVVTNGGLVGKVVRVDGNELDIEVGPNVRVRHMKAMLAEVRARTESGGAAPAAAPAPKPAKSEEPAPYYRALGLKNDASASEIAAAASARSNDAAAVEAYATIGDPTKRKLYDRLGHDEYVATVNG